MIRTILSIQKVINLEGKTIQIRLKLFNKTVFTYSFKNNLNTI